MDRTELKIACTTAFTILFFMCFFGEVGFLTSFVVTVIWFMIWCVLNSILHMLNQKQLLQGGKLYV